MPRVLPIVIVCAIANVATSGATSVAGQTSRVVDSARASALKATYPFVRFSRLILDAPPAAPLHDRLLPQRPRPGEGVRLVPPDANSLNGRQVSIRGYMVPLATDAHGVSEFILSSNIDSCHFGLVGGLNEWALVRMTSGDRVPSAGLSPVTVFGTFSVGEEIRNGYVTSVYRLRADYIALH